MSRVSYIAALVPERDSGSTVQAISDCRRAGAPSQLQLSHSHGTNTYVLVAFTAGQADHDSPA